MPVGERLSTRTAVSVALTMDIDKPVQAKLGLNDDRVLNVVAWGQNAEGGLLLVLADDHDHFAVGRYVVGARRDEQVRRTASEHKRRGLYMTDDEKLALRSTEEASRA